MRVGPAAGSLRPHPRSITIPAMPGHPGPRSFILFALVSAWLLLIVFPCLLPGTPLASGAVYYFFSQVCHQIPDRSFHWAGSQMAVCHRCLGVYLGFWLGALLWPWLGHPRRWLLDRPRLLLAPATVLLLNVLTPNSPIDRVSTGLLAGFPVALFLWIGFEQLLAACIRPGTFNTGCPGPESQGEAHVPS